MKAMWSNAELSSRPYVRYAVVHCRWKTPTTHTHSLYCSARSRYRRRIVSNTSAAPRRSHANSIANLYATESITTAVCRSVGGQCRSCSGLLGRDPIFLRYASLHSISVTSSTHRAPPNRFIQWSQIRSAVGPYTGGLPMLPKVNVYEKSYLQFLPRDAYA